MMGNTWVVDSRRRVEFVGRKIGSSLGEAKRKLFFLEGDLGAGKNNLVRYYLRQLSMLGELLVQHIPWLSNMRFHLV